MAADGTRVPGSIYLYAPNKAAAIVFTVAFFVAFVLHTWQCIRYKAWKVTGLHPLCAMLFAVGFALRSYGGWNYNDVNVYIASTILIYFAPPLLELANYHVLGRILFYVPYFAPLHPGRTLTTFGFLSTVVEILNALGVSYLANPNVPENLQKLGMILMKASLIVQVVVILLFCVIAFIFQRRCFKAGIKNRKVHGPLWTMYISTILILIRTIYRIIEHFGQSQIPRNPGPDWEFSQLSPIVRYEWFFYVFEASLMLVNTYLWNLRHPRRYLPEDYHVYLAQDGKTELLGPGWKDNVPWIITFIDPFGFTACLMEKNGKKEKPFWEDNGFDHVPLVKQQERRFEEV